MSAIRNAMGKWYEPGAIPIYATFVVAIGGVAFYLGRLATSPDVTYSRKNPHPYLAIERDADPRKFMTVNKAGYEKIRQQNQEKSA